MFAKKSGCCSASTEREDTPTFRCTRASAPRACRKLADLASTRELEQEPRSEEHTSELQSHSDLVCRLLLEKKKKNKYKAEIQDMINDYAIILESYAQG